MNSSATVLRRLRVLGRVAVAALSVAVVALSALAWSQLQVLDRSTSTAQVIESPPAPASAEQNILLVGVDSRTDALGNPLPPQLLDALHAGGSSEGGDTADSLTVVHVPAGGGRATAISIPRDAYVQIADGFGKHKINSAYSRAVRSATATLTQGSSGGGSSSSIFAPEGTPTPSESDPAVRRSATAAGARTTIATVEELTGLHISHFASVNLAGFADVSAAIGGVGVCLREPVDDPYSGLLMGAGPQQVSGPQALAFVRQRHGLPNGDLDRITRQQVFLAGATNKLLSAGTLTDPATLDRLNGVLSRSVVLDEGWDLLGFAQRMQGLSAGAVTFRTVPTGSTEMSTPFDGLAVQVDPNQVKGFVAESLAADAGAPRPVVPAAPALTAAPVSPSTPMDDASSDGSGSTRTSGSPAPVSAAAPPITADSPGCIN